MGLITFYDLFNRSCTSPDFGVSGVLDRFQQINPKVRVESVDKFSEKTRLKILFSLQAAQGER